MKQVPGFPGYYATEDGFVWSTWKMGCKPQADARESRKVMPYIHDGGYHQICLRRDGVRFKCYVHEIVLLTFVGPCPPDKDRCRHLDGNPSNNAPSNLAWGTAHENRMDAQKHGTWKAYVLSKAQRAEIHRRYLKGAARVNPNSAVSLGLEFGVSPVNVRMIARKA